MKEIKYFLLTLFLSFGIFSLAQECKETYSLTTNITSNADYKASKSITASSVIGINAKVTFAAPSIILKSGFNVKGSSLFRAYIGNCTPVVVPPPPPGKPNLVFDASTGTMMSECFKCQQKIKLDLSTPMHYVQSFNLIIKNLKIINKGNAESEFTDLNIYLVQKNKVRLFSLPHIRYIQSIAPGATKTVSYSIPSWDFTNNLYFPTDVYYIELQLEKYKTSLFIPIKVVKEKTFSSLNEEENNIQITPNPNSGLFKILLKDIPEGTVQIVNMSGNEIYTKSFKGNTEVEVNIQNQPAGVYVVRIQAGDQIVTKQIIKN